MNQFGITTALIALLVFLTGCNSGIVTRIDPLSNVGATYQNKDLVLKDIPLAQDFVIQDDSFCHGTSSFRYGEFMLRGELSVEDVYFYYKKQMPANFWREVSAQSFSTSSRMKFEKEDEYCTILCKEGRQFTELKIIVEQKKS